MRILRALSAAVLCISLLLSGTSRCSAADDKQADLVKLVIGLLQDKDKDIRNLGLEQVRTEAKGAEATQQFAAELAKLSPEAQVGLLSALADRGDAAALPAVRELLAAAQSEPVKLAAITTLGALGEPADAKALVLVLGSGSAAQQAAARASLVQLRDEGAPAALVAEMKPAAPPIRAALIEILTTRHALSAIADILPAAQDADPKVRTTAMLALGQMAKADQLPGMLQGVLKSEKGPERDAAEKAVALVCLRNDPSQRAAPLLAAWEKLDQAKRDALLSTLGRVGGPQVLAIVEKAIADSDSAQHERGLRSMCNWPDASVAPRLIELAQKDSHPENRALALAALIRVAPLPDKRTTAQRLALVKEVLAMCQNDDQRRTVLKRASAVRDIQTLRLLMPYADQPDFAEVACLSVVELAHHRDLREPNKAEFDRALDKVLAKSKDPTTRDRANRYKKGETWNRPTPEKK